MRKVKIALMILLIVSAVPLTAHSLNLKVGIFQPFLKSDLWDINRENLAFSSSDMLNTSIAAEFEYNFKQMFSLSFEAAYYRKDHYSMYKDWTWEDGSPIFQNLALWMTSFELGFKIYPLGSRGPFSPFVGVGGGVYYWRYEQWGDFINFQDLTISEGYAETTTFSAGFNANAGMKFNFSPHFGFLMQAKYQYVRGQLSSFFEGFELLDLSGMTYQFGLTFQF